VPAAVVASEPHLDPDTLTDAQIVTFVQTYLQANITADGWNLTDGSFLGINTGTTVYSGGYTNNIMQYAVEEVPSLTFTHAFNTLTPSTAADISQITNVAEWRFSSYVIAVDTAARYGLRVTNLNSVYYIIRSDMNFYNSVHWFYDVNTQSVTLESGLSITSNRDPIFVDMIVFSSARDSFTWNGGNHTSGYGGSSESDNNTGKAFMILKSPIDDPIVSFSFRPGAGAHNGAIKSYTIYKHLGAPLADWDAWVTKGRVIANVINVRPEPALPSDGNWEIIKVRTDIPMGTWVSYP
jgi:hypothetical protein